MLRSALCNLGLLAASLALGACAPRPAATTPSDTAMRSQATTRVPTDGPSVVVLGIAQDGGVPQAGSFGDLRWDDASRQRQVVSLGIADPRSGKRWMIDATPDFRRQLLELHRAAGGPARPVLDGILLTHAHMGHYTGLMFLGHESIGASRVPVWAMRRMREFLETNGPWSQLVVRENIELRPLVAGAPVRLADDLAVTPILVPHRQEYSETVAFRIEGPSRAVLWLPDIDSWREWDEMGVRLEDVLRTVDVAYLDGTFFANGEIKGRDMSTFPHPFITTTIERLAALPESERAKVRFIHLNHTNPALDPASPQAAAIRAAGMRVAEQGEVEPLFSR
ncbi:MAG: MBL fold metallo-hydrolase [Planctomycetaceae bacterium]|nr:MBL fold metallo-hydrolase [Planctomycetaceae bacterium]